MNFVTQDQISALSICAEILMGPSKEICNLINDLRVCIPKNNFHTKLDLDLLESEYIQLFSVGSTSHSSVPLASWWLDGKMMGKTAVEIEEFYKKCSCVVDYQCIYLPVDHIGVMLSFVSLLLEEKKSEKAREFITHYLQWIEKLECSVQCAMPKSIFLEVLHISRNILTILKERSYVSHGVEC